MSYLSYVRAYIAFMAVVLILGGCFSFFDVNAFSELGAVVVIFSIVSGVNKLSVGGFFGAISGFEDEVKQRKLKLDVFGGIFGTFINGFSQHIHWLVTAVLG